ncbi:bifunctional hydroxymethylpyrimidine kinase/phosphomethylpyrimidine kinase [Simiduia agarivorans]|uniref:hydroxymethylpyrimidine kinase n=1 Tax=Simiduia agarivorans (strain DSM 21679 / JCM 13881 / BCRC 17597 / SA1) TaxID=1117647 RepID=K4KK75_SIMAS|nr:bifunctional hydroxymethylpyrimidine kinase/phosphomethylpyrimidine kinase [Simiduia agarivorans]AFU99406.1 phosphomethylpyrimidine kinase [Simiduia agarivorans SA1 = DSM 21679]
MSIVQNPQPVLLSIAGSDPSAGAGIQADLKTAAALQVYAVTAVSALTVQNSLGVTEVHPVPPAVLRAQIESLLVDHQIACVKVGMLADPSQVACLNALRQQPVLARVPWIVDTPLRASAGCPLFAGAPDQAYARLLAGATLITPNLQEAAQLTGQAVARDDNDMLVQATTLLQQSAQAVLLKGGHRADQAVDLLLQPGAAPVWFRAPLINTRNSHGTGCTLASAIAAFLVRGQPLARAVASAITFQRACLARSKHYAIGDFDAGKGPLWHFPDPLYPREEHDEQHD